MESLLRARIMSGKMNGRIRKIGYDFNLPVIRTGKGPDSVEPQAETNGHTDLC